LEKSIVEFVAITRASGIGYFIFDDHSIYKKSRNVGFCAVLGLASDRMNNYIYWDLEREGRAVVGHRDDLQT